MATDFGLHEHIQNPASLTWGKVTLHTPAI